MNSRMKLFTRVTPGTPPDGNLGQWNVSEMMWLVNMHNSRCFPRKLGWPLMWGGAMFIEQLNVHSPWCFPKILG